MAAELVAEDASSMMARYPNALVLTAGYFNNCKLNTVLLWLKRDDITWAAKAIS